MAGRLWRHRDFLLLWGGQSISDVGSAVTLLVLPLIAVVYLHASGFKVGALLAGALASALGPRPAVLIMMLGGMLSSVVLYASPLRTMRDLPVCPAGLASATPTAAHT